MPPQFRTTRRIEFADTDAAGIAHFSVFFTYMEQAEHEFLRSRGLSVMTRDAEGSIGFPRVGARCDFRRAVRFEDEIEIELTALRLGEKSAAYDFVIRHDGEVVAEGGLTAVCCRLAHGSPPRSIPIPPSIRDKLSADVAE